MKYVRSMPNTPLQWSELVLTAPHPWRFVIVSQVLCEVRTLGGLVWFPAVGEWCQNPWGCVVLVAGLVLGSVR